MSILLITNQEDITADFVVKSLRKKRLTFYRLNTEYIGRSVHVSFDFSTDQFYLKDTYSQQLIDLNDISSVYFRRPEINSQFTDLSPGEENFVRSELLFTLEGLYRILRNAFWISKVHAIRNAENKLYQLQLAKEIGFHIPDSLVTSEPEVALAFYKRHGQQCIIKPIRSGQVGHDYEEGVIFTSQVELSEKNVRRITSCPVYMQPLIEKQSDVRVTVVGDQLFSARIYSQQREDSSIDWRRSAIPLEHAVLELPLNVSEQCVRLVKALDLQYGAIDFIEDKDGNFIFLEINPNGQWAWIENRLNLNISDAITALLDKAVD